MASARKMASREMRRSETEALRRKVASFSPVSIRKTVRLGSSPQTTARLLAEWSANSLM